MQIGSRSMCFLAMLIVCIVLLQSAVHGAPEDEASRSIKNDCCGDQDFKCCCKVLTEECLLYGTRYYRYQNDCIKLLFGTHNGKYSINCGECSEYGWKC